MIELILRITFSLLVVFGLMWVLARMARRPLTARGGDALAVLHRQQLTRSASVAVVRVADRALVVGVTDGQVTLLGEADLEALERQAAGVAPEKRDAVSLDGADQLVTTQAVVEPGRLAGSALSPATWKQTVNFLRERTVRR